MPESPILESQENECHDSKETKLHLHGIQQYEENQRSEFDECPDEEIPDEMHVQPQDAGYRSKGQSTVAFEYFDNGQIDFRNVASALGLYGPKKGPGPTTKSCEFCGLVVQHPSKIAAHMRTHTGEKPFLCEICGQEFSQRTPYRMHLKRHIGDLPFPCSFCPKKFPNNASRNGHEMRVHRERFPSESSHFKPISNRIVHPYAKPRSPETQNADQIYSSSTTRSIRSPIVHWQPPVGDIRPTSETAMRKITSVVEAVASGHKSVPAQKPSQAHFCRSQDNIYTVPSRPAPTVAQCAECGLVFKHPSKIQAHMRTHTGEKPFLCEQCGLACSTNSALRVHIKRFHTRERPHECTWECGMRFVSVAARNEHERIVHAGIKRYQCTVGDCRRLFTRRSYLMKHLSKDHPSQIGDNSQAIQNVDYSKLPHNYPAEANVSANVSYPDFENAESGHATNVSKILDPANICFSQSTAKMENVHEKGQESFDSTGDFFVEDHGGVSYSEYSPDAAEFFAAMPSGYDQMTESESYSAHLQEPHHLPHLTQNFRYREDFQQEPFQYHFAGKHSNE
ncbi:zinc-finger double domain-containing protein [Ditylenchus destructor]|nr:zinc-finger double domain-containing protein [Ditylenchus destructor]